MVSTIALAAIAIVVYWVYTIFAGLSKHTAAAKRSGLPYIVTPIGPYNVVWLTIHKMVIPLLENLPSAWTEPWLDFTRPDWMWDLLFEPVKKAGDIFLAVHPGGIHIWVTNAEAMHQITSRREAFPKPLESYKILEIFGRNIISTEGAEWKRHRKVSSPGFNEKNNVLVFAEACRQTHGMVRKWLGPNGAGNITVKEAPTDTMRLTLHIISSIGFGVQLLWPGESIDRRLHTDTAIYSSNEPPEGHTMTFENSLTILLERLILVLMLPESILKRLPFQKTREAYESLINWRQYMNELLIQKVYEARQGQRGEGMDIMGTLVKSSYGESTTERKSSLGRVENGESNKITLSDSDILGNAFVMIVAGHETTANAVHFSLIELAISPRPQRLVQKEVQNIFGDETPEKWDYDSNINALLGSIVGAVMNEQLRLMPPVIAIPKSVTESQDQVITLDGEKYTLPAGARIALNTVGTHRNPKYWPTQPSKVTDAENDLNDFRPERWLITIDEKGAQQVDSATDSENDDDFGGYTGQTSSSKLFHPVRGSYLPFSEGPRSCVGRRLAQVEVMAVLATIFQKYSIELAVDEWASDEEVKRMSDSEKRAVYKKAQDKARETLRSATPLLTLKLNPGFIPIRLVKKGEERFICLIN